MDRLNDTLQPFKFKLTVFGLLYGATLVSLILFRLRTSMAHSTEYAFLVWNIFLAWIPLGMACIASIYLHRRKNMAIVVPLAALLWLVFFPNAPYILTDLQHLAPPKPDVPLWFDTLLILWFASTGLLLGLVSLFLMHGIVAQTFGRLPGWVFVLIVGILSSLGIYLGRFLRWNSWDVFVRPLERLSDFMYYASHPSLRSILFIGAFAGLFIFIYITMYACSLLLREQAHQITKEVTT